MCAQSISDLLLPFLLDVFHGLPQLVDSGIVQFRHLSLAKHHFFHFRPISRRQGPPRDVDVVLLQLLSIISFVHACVGSLRGCRSSSREGTEQLRLAMEVETFCSMISAKGPAGVGELVVDQLFFGFAQALFRHVNVLIRRRRLNAVKLARLRFWRGRGYEQLSASTVSTNIGGQFNGAGLALVEGQIIAR